jgi:DNA-binding NarL/FixJ family response regulator
MVSGEVVLSNEGRMKILIDLYSHLMSEAIYQLLVRSGYDEIVVSGGSPTNGFIPHILLVDVTTVRDDLLSQHPDAKILLIDTGTEPEKLFTTLLTHTVHGVLSPHTKLHLLKKALKAITEGQIWIDNGSVKALLRDTGAVSKTGKISDISDREKDIIEYVCRGLSNKQIARCLTLSEHTVKTHLNIIFKKFNIRSRTKLMTLAIQSPLAGSG